MDAGKGFAQCRDGRIELLWQQVIHSSSLTSSRQLPKVVVVLW